MSNLIGTASTTQQLQLEALNEVIKLLIEKEAKLDARISERGSIIQVPFAAFRCASRPRSPATSPCSTWTAAFCRPATSAPGIRAR